MKHALAGLALAFALSGHLAVASAQQPSNRHPIVQAAEKCAVTISVYSPGSTAREAIVIIREAIANAACVAPIEKAKTQNASDDELKDLADTLPSLVDAVQKMIAADLEQCLPDDARAKCQALNAVAHRAALLADAYGKLAGGQYASPLDNIFQIDPQSFGFIRGRGPLSFARLALLADKEGTVRSALPPDDARSWTVASVPPSYIIPNAVLALSCQDCVDAAKSLIPVVIYAKILEAAHYPLQKPVFKEALDEITVISAKWESYHFGGGYSRVQLPQELFLNNLIYGGLKADKGALGFQEPPPGAVVFLHPSVGVSLKTKDGADSTIAGVVEVLGYSHWGYDKEGKRGDEWGASIIGAYQPSDEADDWGYGVLVRTPWQNLNIAWVRTELDAGGSDDALLFSLDVSALIGDLGKTGIACRFGFGVCN